LGGVWVVLLGGGCVFFLVDSVLGSFCEGSAPPLPEFTPRFLPLPSWRFVQPSWNAQGSRSKIFISAALVLPLSFDHWSFELPRGSRGSANDHFLSSPAPDGFFRLNLDLLFSPTLSHPYSPRLVPLPLPFPPRPLLLPHLRLRGLHNISPA